MTQINKKMAVGVVVAMTFGSMPVVMAHQGGKANAGYVGDSRGHLETSSSGECVKTGTWTKELALAECDPSAVPKKAEAAPAPKPVPAPAAAPAPAPAPVVAEKITLKAGALFDVGKADLKGAGMRELDDVAAKLKGTANIESIAVTGHTDNQGAAALNQQLSEQRANAVKNYLVGKGVDGSKISTRGVGAAQPAASNATAEGRAQNRRVELDIKASK